MSLVFTFSYIHVYIHMYESECIIRHMYKEKEPGHAQALWLVHRNPTEKYTRATRSFSKQYQAGAAGFRLDLLPENQPCVVLRPTHAHLSSRLSGPCLLRRGPRRSKACLCSTGCQMLVWFRHAFMYCSTRTYACVCSYVVWMQEHLWAARATCKKNWTFHKHSTQDTHVHIYIYVYTCIIHIRIHVRTNLHGEKTSKQ